MSAELGGSKYPARGGTSDSSFHGFLGPPANLWIPQALELTVGMNRVSSVVQEQSHLQRLGLTPRPAKMRLKKILLCVGLWGAEYR